MEEKNLESFLQDKALKERVEEICQGLVESAIERQLTSTKLADILAAPDVKRSLQAILNRATADKNAEAALHYGNLRFAVFSGSVAILGGMFALALHPEYRATFKSGNVLEYFGWAGILLSMILFLIQYRITESLIFYQNEASTLGSITKRPGTDNWKWIARVAMLLPYGAAAVCWLLLMYRSEVFEK